MKTSLEEKELIKRQNEEIKRQRQLIREQYNQMLIDEENRRKQPKTAPENVYISLQNINKVYDNYVQAVFDFNLDIQKHELIVFVGPSGCGKSTTLRMIAGLEEITTGDLYIDGVYCNEKTAKERDIAMVFQNYALYPHMTVYENLAFGLQTRKYSKEEIDERVKRAAEILQITEYLQRRPKELSGGQMQRVALGRAIVREAKVFLMDEPLSNLDAKLRVSMRSEIINLHKKINATTIYVTHDQTEAMTMASRIVVMKKGYVQQIGTPEEVYTSPANTFVATFIGAPAMNLVDCRYSDGKLIFENGFEIALNPSQIAAHTEFYKARIAETEKLIEQKDYEKPDMNVLLTLHKEKPSIKALIAKIFGKKRQSVKIKTPQDRLEELQNLLEEYKKCLSGEHGLTFGIRPEDICENAEIPSNVKKSEKITLNVDLAELLGSEYHIHMRLGSNEIIAKCKVTKHISDNTDFEFVFDLNKMHLFDKISTKSIL